MEKLINSQVTPDEFICIRKSYVRGATVRPNRDVDTRPQKKQKQNKKNRAETSWSKDTSVM